MRRHPSISRSVLCIFGMMTHKPNAPTANTALANGVSEVVTRLGEQRQGVRETEIESNEINYSTLSIS